MNPRYSNSTIEQVDRSLELTDTQLPQAKACKNRGLKITKFRKGVKLLK